LAGSLTQFYLIFLIIGLAGNGITQIGYSGAVSSWFNRRRGGGFHTSSHACAVGDRKLWLAH
jgi:hypothetical protein